MRYLSVCSGIEAATVAWHPLGWTAAAYSEIEKFPSQVLAHHYPNVPNLGDMTKFKEWNLGTIDLLVGGTPCQSFSVAGLRKGLDDPRGNLMLTYLAIAAKFRPKWLVWENVPGVLSSNGGLDFASLLRGMGECGYGFAYRVLDAQYFGVAQRRKRVFVVGCLGDWRAAAAVLFERHSLCGYPAPSREKRKGLASRIGPCAPDGGETIGTLMARDYKGIGNQDLKDGRGLVLDPIPIDSMNHIGRGDKHSMGDFVSGAPSYTLTKGHSHAVAQPIAYAFDSLSSNSMKSANPVSGCNKVEISKSLDTSRGLDPSCNQGGIGVAQPIAYNIAPGKGALKDDIHVTTADATKTLDASGSNPAMHQGGAAILQLIAFSAQMSNPQTDVDMTQTLQAKNPMAVVSPTLTAANNPSRSPQSSEVTQQVYSVYQSSMAVRRLTPVECERLQGFPDNYTDIQPKGKATPDGPRYKALGNSMAVPVMAWIGKRIQEVEKMQCKQNK